MTPKTRNVRACTLGAGILVVLIVGWMALAPAQPVALLSLPEASGTVNDVLVLPLDIQDVDGAEAGEIWVVFDSTVVYPRADSLEVVDFGLQIQAFWPANTVRDTLKIVFATVDGGYVGSGTLVTMQWELRGVGTSALHFERIILERDDMGTPVMLPATGDDGSVAVEPVAVEAGTWGRVKHRFTRTP